MDTPKPDNEAARARTSGLPTTKSLSIKGTRGKSGGSAVKAVELTSGGLRRVPDSGLRPPQGGLTAAQKSAEGIVPGAPMGRGRPERCGRASRNGRLMTRMRQKIQLELAFPAEERGEAPRAAGEGTERVAARAGTERPADTERLMEEIPSLAAP